MPDDTLVIPGGNSATIQWAGTARPSAAPPHRGLHDVDGQRRPPARFYPRPERRTRLRPRTTHLPLPRKRLPPHRYARKDREGNSRREDSSCRSRQEARFQPPASSPTAPPPGNKTSPKAPAFGPPSTKPTPPRTRMSPLRFTDVDPPLPRAPSGLEAFVWRSPQGGPHWTEPIPTTRTLATSIHPEIPIDPRPGGPDPGYSFLRSASIPACIWATSFLVSPKGCGSTSFSRW